VIYTDRSRYETGLDRCPRLRYLQYHAGPNGYGIRKARRSMPLLVGGLVHDALAAVLFHVKQSDELPKEEVIRQAIQGCADSYRKEVETFGLQQVETIDQAVQEQVIQEQIALLKGLVWSWCIEVLPEIHSRYKVVDVEREELLELDDDIAVQGRSDWIGELRESPGTYGWHEFKTASMFHPVWEAEWETKLQFALGVIAAEKRYGCEFHEHYVHGLAKGRRSKPRDGGPKYQDSPYCWAWVKPGNPPLEPDRWEPEFRWEDEFGKIHTLGRGFQRRQTYLYPDAPEGWDPVEYWVRQLPDRVRRNRLKLIGPLNRQRVMIESLQRQVLGEERKWQTILMELYTVAEQCGANYWTHPDFQAALDWYVPQSWSCLRYGSEHGCEMIPVCFREPGWEDPLNNGYTFRKPHHEPELEQMRERGLEPEMGWGDEDE